MSVSFRLPENRSAPGHVEFRTPLHRVSFFPGLHSIVADVCVSSLPLALSSVSTPILAVSVLCLCGVVSPVRILLSMVVCLCVAPSFVATCSCVPFLARVLHFHLRVRADMHARPGFPPLVILLVLATLFPFFDLLRLVRLHALTSLPAHTDLLSPIHPSTRLRSSVCAGSSARSPSCSPNDVHRWSPYVNLLTSAVMHALTVQPTSVV
eukprot:1887752-Pleurochrysis_carterae.AAC.3